MHDDDDGDIVHSVMIAGVKVTYTLNTVKRYFVDAYSLAQKTGVQKVQNHPVGLQRPNKVYSEGKHE